MPQTIQLSLSPKQAASSEGIQAAAAALLNLPKEQISHIRLLKRSIDARKRKVKIQLKVEVFIGEDIPENKIERHYQNVSSKEEVVIVGSGPAGLFAALKLIELGMKPIVLERGKDVQSRRRDLAAINKEHIVNPDSNYCFGEGGAGTYSDGKLYTRSKKRGSIQSVLETMVFHGAKEDILIDAHPHIGTNKLPKLIAAMRETIINAGGEVHFNTRVSDFILEKDEIKGVITHNGDQIEGKGVILATGHSARDIFFLLQEKNILLQGKPFAMGVRIEHPQALIDQIQYSCDDRGPYLPAASYRLVEQVNGRGIYSFCMCPGGFIVPAATAPGEVVVNGMSPSKRDSFFANSGMVVEVKGEDLIPYHEHGALAGLHYQMALEKMAFEAGHRMQIAPAQRMADFVKGKTSGKLNSTSYQPGIISAPLHELLPEAISQTLKRGFEQFGKKMKGYLTNEANILGVESRTSSPVLIPRDRESLEHTQIKKLYPCGEGAGYAGGIVSAAIDGERCATALFEQYSNNNR
jgi:uncharacterized FAD-dependent dehydrogenase